MAQVALFHPSLGVTPGVADAASRLRGAGHEVLVVDQYEGRTFDDYDEADAFVGSVGFPELMRRAVTGVQQLADGFVAAGFSNGAGMAEYVATQRTLAGVLMFSGALPVEMLGAPGWPQDLPAQIHYTEGDPRRRGQWVDALTSSIRAVGAALDVYRYPGDGHLFTDPSLAEEYQPTEAALLWTRVLAFEALTKTR